ncbi:MAG TPA: SO2930 family diheme c-type cytochrome [Fulvivirga sp.]|nr:SO2930 family diheme c-type cytochrome [Fulvivirga sp.]
MKYLLPFLLIVSLSCSHKESKKEVAVEKSWQMPDTAAYLAVGKIKLSDYGFFEGHLADLSPVHRVFPYDINSPLFSDYALKKRFIYLPEGEQITYNSTDPFDFPEGSVLIKNFYFSDEQLGAGKGKIIETRLLIKTQDTWKSLPYVWNEEQTEAYLEVPGRTVPLTLLSLNKKILYSVPTMMQCKSCHDSNGKMVLIGPSARQLNKAGQLEKLVAMNWIKNVPAPSEWPTLTDYTDNSEPLHLRARAYLEINCAHCHNANGPTKNSGLDLTTTAQAPLAMGIFKAPIAAGKGTGGLLYDIVPGHPDQSILLYRMQSVDPAIMMPEIGKSIVHKEGVKLIADWISTLEK